MHPYEILALVRTVFVLIQFFLVNVTYTSIPSKRLNCKKKNLYWNTDAGDLSLE